MGFFDLKATCAVCDKSIGLNRFQLSKNVWICPKCLQELGGQSNWGNIRKTNVTELRKMLNIPSYENASNLQREKFSPTKSIGNYIYFDEINKKFKIQTNSQIFLYSDIVDFELLEEGNSIEKGGVGRAVVGNLLFGSVGAIVGGATGHKSKNTCTNLKVKITLNNIKTPVEYIVLIYKEVEKDNYIYKNAINIAQEIISVLQIICSQNKTATIVEESSNIDEIKKYKNLLDIGAITKEEFEKKKKSLLNL